MSWRAGMVRPSDKNYTMTARDYTNSPSPSIASARSVSSRLTEGRRSKLERILNKEEKKPKRKIQQQRRRRRPPRVSSSNDLRKIATHQRMEHQRKQSRSVEPRIQRDMNSMVNRDNDLYDEPYNEPYNVRQQQQKQVEEASRRGVTVILPEPVFFNGMNCIERPHWSVADVGRASNGEDQTMSISMWLSPSNSLRLKRTGGQLAKKAQMKSNLARQALNGNEELQIHGSSSGGSSNTDMYVILNRQKCNHAQSTPIDRMLSDGVGGVDGIGEIRNDIRRGDRSGGGSSPDLVAPTLDTLAQHQLDAAILGVDFISNGQSTPKISIDGSTGKICIQAQYRSHHSDNISDNDNGASPMLSEKSLISNNTCSFGKWTHVVIVIAGPTIRLYLDGILDSSMYLNGPVYMPKECDLYIGRHKPATDIVGSSNDDLGFVGFLAHLIVHSKALDKTGIEAMANAPRPALPREQDEWSSLSEYDAMMDKRKAREDRKKQLKQMMTVREELDAQVAYNLEMKKKAIEDEREADRRHLSKYGAMDNQLKLEQRRQAKIIRENARLMMESQKKVEELKNRSDQEKRMSEEVQEVRLLQREVRKYQLDQQMAKEKAMKQAQKEAKEYLRLKHENFLKKEAEKLKAMKEREEAENAANTYRTEMTARETEERRKRRQYRQELDAQVELKYAGNSSKSHLSPTERGMNRRMLANMARMDLLRHDAETGSQWSGSQYSVSFGGGYGSNTVKSPGSIRTSRLGGTNGVGGSIPGAAIANGSISPVDPGWRGSSGSRYAKTSAVSRQEILDLLDSDINT